MGRIFSLTEAHALLPAVKAATAEAVAQTDELATRLQAIEAEAADPALEPERARLGAALNDVVLRWVGQIQDLGVEPKGLWLVDFDNGSGYYCWRHPEEALRHFHGYEDGFAGRMSIV